MNITNLHSRLLKHIQDHDDRRLYYEGLQDKLTQVCLFFFLFLYRSVLINCIFLQVKDARAALDALREEHRDKLRREAEEAERQRQLQMAHKLEIMRKKKQEYLQYQRQLALQRIQEQEREMQMRQVCVFGSLLHAFKTNIKILGATKTTIPNGSSAICWLYWISGTRFAIPTAEFSFTVSATQFCSSIPAAQSGSSSCRAILPGLWTDAAAQLGASRYSIILHIFYLGVTH